MSIKQNTMEVNVPADGRLHGYFDWHQPSVAWIAVMVTRDPDTKAITVHNIGKHTTRANAIAWINEQFDLRPWEKA